MAETETSGWKFFLIYLKVHFIINALMIVELFRGIVNLFIPTRYKKIKDKLALVTGGGNGIGRAIALKLAEKGCNIAIADIDSLAAEKTARFIAETFNVKAKAFEVDVSDSAAVLKLKRDIENSLGYVDLLVNNAGVLSLNLSLREKTPAEVEKVISINLMSHFWTVRAFLDGMIERKYGHIIAVGSFSGKVTIPYAVAYCTSKFGVTGFMSALFDELVVLGHDEYIKTTTIYPSFVNTNPILKEYVPNDIPMISAESVAEQAVNGILRNQRNIFIPGFIKIACGLNFLPERVIKILKTRSMTPEIVEKRRMHMTQPV